MQPRWDELDRYVVISADTHAGAEMRQYKQYLPSKWHEEFEDWAANYSSPWDDLVDKTAYRNWDSDARLAELEAEGVAAELVFPNTVPPFFPTVETIANPPKTREEYERRWAGVQCHNRWLIDFCDAAPGRRRGLIQVMPNDLDDAVAEIHWAATTGVIGSVLIPAVPANYADLPPVFSRYYDPIWRACEETGLVVTNHSGTGLPDYDQTDPSTGPVTLYEFTMWSQRTFEHMMLSAAFERFPNLKFVMTEQGGPSWYADALRRLDGWVEKMKDTSNRTYSMFAPGLAERMPLKPSDYFERNCYIGASFMPPQEIPHVERVGAHKVMWGIDYPHEEGTTPYTHEALRNTFHSVPEHDVRLMLGGVVAGVYGFDLDALVPVAQRVGPKVADIAVPLAEHEMPQDSWSGAFEETLV